MSTRQKRSAKKTNEILGKYYWRIYYSNIRDGVYKNKQYINNIYLARWFHIKNSRETRDPYNIQS